MKKTLFLLLLFISSFSFYAQKNEFIIASYNLRYDEINDGENRWDNRKEMVKELINYHEFDIVATQELLINQINDLLEMADWAYTGAGRDDGTTKGEHSAIFYKKELFQLLDSGDFWLSETPEKPGKGWDATCCNRICSWAKLKHIENDFIFYLFNAHFDHEGETARVESGYLITSKIKEIAKDYPVILSGDFNSTPETEQMKHISSILDDSFHITKQKPYGPIGTFNDFKIDAEFDERIDYIFVSKHFIINKYATLTDSKHKRFPSDHIPVVVKLEYK